MALFEKKEDYLELLKEQIRCKKAKSLVAEEMENHIEDQKDSYILEGYDEHTALMKSLEQMGDPVAVGKQMDKIHKPRMEWHTLLLVLALCVLGIIAQISLTNSYEVSKLKPILDLDVSRHILFMGAGLLLMVLVYFLDYSIIGRYPKVIWVLLLTGVLLYASFGVEVNGSLLYLYAYGMLFIPAYGGILYAYRKRGYGGIVKCLLFSITASTLELQYITQCSVYLGLILSSLLMLSAAILKNWFGISKKKGLVIVWGWTPAAVFISLFGGLGYLGEYRLARLRSMIDTLLHPGFYAKGYQMQSVRGIISQAELFGGAPNFSIGYLPGLNNDYILTYVIGRWGIVPGLLIIIIFTLLIGRMILLSLNLKNFLGMFVGLGCSLVFALQGSIYILSNLGIQFIAQVNLPFVSYGGFSLLINFIVLGLMLSVFRNKNIAKEKPYKDKIILHIERVK